MECSGRLQISLFLLLGFHFNPSFSMGCSGSIKKALDNGDDHRFNPSFSMECSGSCSDVVVAEETTMFQS